MKHPSQVVSLQCIFYYPFPVQSTLIYCDTGTRCEHASEYSSFLYTFIPQAGAQAINSRPATDQSTGTDPGPNSLQNELFTRRQGPVMP